MNFQERIENLPDEISKLLLDADHADVVEFFQAYDETDNKTAFVAAWIELEDTDETVEMMGRYRGEFEDGADFMEKTALETGMISETFTGYMPWEKVWDDDSQFYKACECPESGKTHIFGA